MQLHSGTKVVRPMPPLRLSTRSRPKTGAGLKSSMGSSSPAPGSGAKSLNSSIGSKSWPLSSSLLLSSVPDRLTDHMYPSCCTHMLRPPHSLLGPAVSLLGLPPQTTQQSFTVNQETSPHAILSPAPGPSTSGASYLLRQSGKKFYTLCALHCPSICSGRFRLENTNHLLHRPSGLSPASPRNLQHPGEIPITASPHVFHPYRCFQHLIVSYYHTTLYALRDHTLRD